MQESAGVYRDAVALAESTVRGARGGRAYVAVIGIDRYHAWDRLYNAVSDATGALDLFLRLGFEPVGVPLFDELATRDALHRLVSDDLAALGPDDSLVLFFAGHGHTVSRSYYGGAHVKDGYIIPVDGDRPGGRAGTWLRLTSWLADVTRLPAKHILVLLDACHSGLALDPIIRWRGTDMRSTEPLERLCTRRSRRIITSALDDQRAMDGGPVPGHSLFTGCLIEGLTGGLVASTGQTVVTGSEIGLYIQRRVSEYPNSTQTPDFGALELDDRGELVVHLGADLPPAPQPATPALELPAQLPSRSTRIAAVTQAMKRGIRAISTPTRIAAVIVGALAIILYLLASSAPGERLREAAPRDPSRDSNTQEVDTRAGSAGVQVPLGSGSGATRTVHWKLRSTPSGARVIDPQGHPLGTTPLSIERPSESGQVDVVIRHEGYFDRELSLDGALDVDREEALIPMTDKNIPIVD